MDCNEYIEEKPFLHIRFFMMNTGDVFEDVFRAFVLEENGVSIEKVDEKQYSGNIFVDYIDYNT